MVGENYRETTVSTVEAAKNAMKAKYDTIIVTGEAAKSIGKEVRKSKIGGAIGTTIGVAGFFGAAAIAEISTLGAATPAVAVGAGALTAIISGDGKKYNIKEVTDDRIVLVRKLGKKKSKEKE